MIVYEEEKPYVNAEEMKRLIMCMAFLNQIRDCSAVVKKRVSYQKGKGRMYGMWRCAVGMLDKVMTCIYDGLPLKSLRHMYAMSKGGEVMVRMKPTAEHGHGDSVLLNEDLVVLLNAAMEGKCSLCIADGREARDCELRKTLMAVMPPDELPKTDICPYTRGVVEGFK